MKFAKYFKPVVLLLTTIFSLFFVGCEKDTQLISPEEDLSMDRLSAVSADGKTIYFLGFEEFSLNSLQKVVTSQKYVTKQQGGIITLSVANAGLSAQFTLTIPPNSIDGHKTVSMTFDDQNFQGFTDLVFGPHGTQFSIPALLDVSLSGLNLGGVNPNKIKLYYVNDNGQWEEMITGSIQVIKSTGVVVIDDARIPHFSRYAVAAE